MESVSGDGADLVVAQITERTQTHNQTIKGTHNILKRKQDLHPLEFPVRSKGFGRNLGNLILFQPPGEDPKIETRRSSKSKLPSKAEQTLTVRWLCPASRAGYGWAPYRGNPPHRRYSGTLADSPAGQCILLMVVPPILLIQKKKKRDGMTKGTLSSSSSSFGAIKKRNKKSFAEKVEWTPDPSLLLYARNLFNLYKRPSKRRRRRRKKGTGGKIRLSNRPLYEARGGNETWQGQKHFHYYYDGDGRLDERERCGHVICCALDDKLLFLVPSLFFFTRAPLKNGRKASHDMSVNERFPLSLFLSKIHFSSLKIYFQHCNPYLIEPVKRRRRRNRRGDFRLPSFHAGSAMRPLGVKLIIRARNITTRRYFATTTTKTTK